MGLINLLRALPEGVMDLTAAPGSPSIAQLFTYMHYVRLVFVEEDAPEFVREAVRDRVAGDALDDDVIGATTWGVWMRKTQPVRA